MRNCIEARGLCKAYPGFALQKIDLTLPGGTILGLLGENGAGKTTAIRCLLGMIPRDAGEVRLLERDDLDAAREDCGVVLDECLFHDTLRPKDLNLILAPVYQTWDRDLFQDYLEKFQLPAGRYVKEFSRGMKMKLSIATALAHRPKLLVLDEATAGLDPLVRDELLDELRAFVCDEDHAVLLSSHITSDLEKIADYVTYLHQGRAVLSGTKDEILDSYGRVACTAKEFAGIDPADLLRVRRGEFGCEALVASREEFRKKYPGLLVERTTLEEILLFLGKGERK